MIIILDYGMGNPASILNMIRKVGGNALISMDADMITSASAIILPGVGAFDNGITKLRASGILNLIEKKVLEEKVPFLGICLGMQLLFNSSEEGKQTGLGWIKGSVKRFDFSTVESQQRLKVPHMGWNEVMPKSYTTLYSGLEEARFYFVHSYHAVCENPSHVLATTKHGYEFICSVQNDNIFGVQFHPEKSHRFGMTLFKNFLDMT